MVDQEMDTPLDESQEEKKVEQKPKPKPKTKTTTAAKAKTKTTAKPKAKTKTKTKTAAKPAAKTEAVKPISERATEAAEELKSSAQSLLSGSGEQQVPLLGIGVVVIGGMAIIALLLVFVFSGGSGKNILIGFPDNDWNVDVFLLQYGDDEDDGVRIAKDVDYGGATIYVVEDGLLTKEIDGFGFVPDSSQILFSYIEDDETFIEQMTLKDEESSELFDSEDDIFSLVYGEQERIFFFEYQDEGVRCYAADFGEEADRIDKGADCWPSIDGRYLAVIEEDDEETTFLRYDLQKDKDEEFLTVEDLFDYRFSEDLSMLAYVVNTSGDEQELHLFDVDREEDEDLVEDYFIPDFGFTSAGDLYYLVENEDGDLEAFVYGSSSPIAEGTMISITPGPEGDFLLIISGEDEDDLEVFSYSMRKEESESVVDGEYLQLAVTTDPAQVFISELSDGDLTIYTSDMDGGNLSTIYEEGDVLDFRIWTITGHEFFYLVIDTEDGEYLLGYQAGSEESFVLLEEYEWIEPLNVSANGRNLVFAAAEDPGDDPILFSVRVKEGEEPEELDDDSEGYYNAIFMGNDRDVLYTAINGDDPDEISINLVSISDGERPETLYDEAYLFDVQWGVLDPFYPVEFSWLYGGGY